MSIMLCEPPLVSKSLPARDARQWPRLSCGADVRDVRLRFADAASGTPLEKSGEVVDESLGGLGLVVESDAGLIVGQVIEIVCTMPVMQESLGDFADMLPTEISSPALVRDLAQRADGRWRVGVQWIDG